MSPPLRAGTRLSAPLPAPLLRELHQAGVHGELEEVLPTDEAVAVTQRQRGALVKVDLQQGVVY